MIGAACGCRSVVEIREISCPGRAPDRPPCVHAARARAACPRETPRARGALGSCSSSPRARGAARRPGPRSSSRLARARARCAPLSATRPVVLLRRARGALARRDRAPPGPAPPPRLGDPAPVPPPPRRGRRPSSPRRARRTRHPPLVLRHLTTVSASLPFPCAAAARDASARRAAPRACSRAPKNCAFGVGVDAVGAPPALHADACRARCEHRRFERQHRKPATADGCQRAVLRRRRRGGEDRRDRVLRARGARAFGGGGGGAHGGSRCPRQESAREGCVTLFAVGARVCAPIALLHRVAGGNACASLTRARARASSAETATRAVRFAPPHRAEDGQICQDRARRGTRALRPDSARELLQLHRPVWPCFDRE